MKSIIKVTTVLFIIFSQIIYAQNSQLWGDLKKGNYEIGFKVIEKYDETRTIDPGKSKRPIQISLWYPAETAVENSRLFYKDYISLLAHEIDFSNSTDSSKLSAIKDYTEKITSRGIPFEAVKLFMNSEMEAYSDAVPAKGKFPLIIIGQGNFHPSVNLSILCEYLASHGFYAATCASPTRVTGQITDSTQVYDYAVDQRDDMKFIFDELKDYQNININEVGVIGYSFGGRGAFLLLNDFDFVKAYVSFDSGFANKIGKHWLDGIKINVDKITSPILHIYQDIESFVIPDFELANSLVNCERFLLKIDNMKHGFFYNVGMAIGVIPGFDLPAIDKDSTKMKFETVNKTTLGFFNNYLKNINDEYWNKTVSRTNENKSFTELKILKK